MSHALKRRIEHLERTAPALADVPMPSSICLVAGKERDERHNRREHTPFVFRSGMGRNVGRKKQKTRKACSRAGFLGVTGGDGGIRTLDAGFARMLP